MTESSKGYTVEHHMRIYDDTHGWYVTVRPDTDIGESCEIAWNDGGPNDKDSQVVVLPWPMARLMAQAILNASPTSETAS